MQKSVKNPDIVAASSTGYSPIMFSLFSKSEGTRSKCLWKHNNSLCEKSTCINSMKKDVISTLENFKNENNTDEHSMLEYLKYEITKSSKNFFKEAGRSKKIESSALETKLKILESKIRYSNDPEHIHCKEEPEKLHQEKIDGAIIRSRCYLYEHWKKSPKFFLNLEENYAVQNQIRTIPCCEKEITDEKEINTELFKFYKALFEPKVNVPNALIQDYLNRLEIPKLTKEQSQKCEGTITEEKLVKALKKKMPSNKSPGNDGITKEFYKVFWDDLKTPLLLSVNKAFKVG